MQEMQASSTMQEYDPNHTILSLPPILQVARVLLNTHKIVSHAQCLLPHTSPGRPSKLLKIQISHAHKLSLGT